MILQLLLVIRFLSKVCFCNFTTQSQKGSFKEDPKRKQSNLNLIVNLFSKLTETKKFPPVFGIPIEALVDRDKPANGIPHVVKSLVEFLKTSNIFCGFTIAELSTEGMFRISGSTSEISKIKEHFNKSAADQTLNLEQFQVASVAGALKQYFRELPEPLLMFSSFQPMMDLESQDAPANKKVDRLRIILEKIPPSHLKVLKYLCEFFDKIAGNSATNKMTYANIAIVFGPNLIYSTDDSLETLMNSPRIVPIVQLLFEYHRFLLSYFCFLLRASPGKRERKMDETDIPKASVQRIVKSAV